MVSTRYLAPAPLVAAVLLMALPRALAHARQDNLLGIEELRALAANRSASVRSLRLSYDVFQEPMSYSADIYIPHLSRTVLVDAATGRFSMDRTMETEGSGHGAGTQTVTLAFDGQIQVAFVPDSMIGLVKEGADVDGLVECGLWGVMLLGEPQPGGLGIDDGSLESLLAHGVVRNQLEVVGEARCHVVDAFYEGVRYASVWLDAGRGLLPMKRVGYGRDGLPSSTVTVDSVFFLEKAQVWLPGSWHTEIQARGETLRTYAVVEQGSLEINPPLTDEDFRPQFPPGTIVTDQIAGIAYRVGDAGAIGEILYERSNDAWIAVAPPVDAEGASQGEPSGAAPILDTLGELMEFIAPGRAPEPPAESGRDAAAAETGPRTGQDASDSKGPARSDNLGRTGSGVEPSDALLGPQPRQVRGPVDAGPPRERSSRSLWSWALGAVAVAALVAVGYSVKRGICREG